MARRSGFTRTALWVALSVAAQGCASPGTPVTQTVRVETPGCAQVACELSNDRGHWSLPRTPGSVSLISSREPLKVSCRADEGAVGDAGASSSMKPTTGAGAVTGGVVGGAAVGAAFGATALAFIPVLGVITVLSGVAVGAAAGQAAESGQRALRYPEVISVPMACTDAAGLAPPMAAPLGLVVRGLTPDQAREAGVGARGAVLVISVVAGGRAAAAGLRSGDVILAADGHDLSDAADLEERVRAQPPGTPLALRVWRSGQVLVLAMTRAAVAP